MDMNKLLEDLEKLRSEVSESQDKAMSALSDADDALDEANSAETSACNASSHAFDAKEKINEVDDELRDYVQRLDAIMDMIREQSEEVSTDRSLKSDMDRWRDKVMAGVRAGHTPARIAAALSISEFLVQCIIDEKKDAA